MIKHHSTTPNVHSCAYRDFSHNFWKMYVEVIDLNIFKNNKFVAKVDLWSFGVTSTHLLKCNIRSVLCLTNFPLHPQIEVLRIPPWFFRFPTQHSDIGQASYQRPFFFLHSHASTITIYTLTSVSTFSILFFYKFLLLLTRRICS